MANSDFYKPKHLYSWKTLLRSEKNWDAIAEALRANKPLESTREWRPACVPSASEQRARDVQLLGV